MWALPPAVLWGKSLSGVQHVKVLINATSFDSQLLALRTDILLRGGSVFYNDPSVLALSATVPETALMPRRCCGSRRAAWRAAAASTAGVSAGGRHRWVADAAVTADAD